MTEGDFRPRENQGGFIQNIDIFAFIARRYCPQARSTSPEAYETGYSSCSAAKLKPERTSSNSCMKVTFVSLL